MRHHPTYAHVPHGYDPGNRMGTLNFVLAMAFCIAVTLVILALIGGAFPR